MRRPPLLLRTGAARPGPIVRARAAGKGLGLLKSLRRPSGPELEARIRAESRSRTNLVLVGLGLFLAGLALRASWVMVVPDERLEERGRDQFQAAEERQGQRGSIHDRNGRLLAMTVTLPALYANPSKLSPEDLSRRIGAIASLTGKSEAWLQARFAARNAAGNGLQEIRLGSSLDPGRARAVVHGLGRDVMWLVEEPVRLYPGKDLASPLLGFTDGSGDGAAGLERVLQRELAGESYRILVAHDRKGRAIDAGVDDTRLARAGHSVRLTIDSAIQHATEEALDAVMVSSQPETAMAVVMDVRTGAILAMASRPSGNANDGASRARQVLFKNYPAMDQIEPGSVMKPFIAAAALEEGLVTPDTMVDCELGSWFIGGRTIRDDHPKGVVSVTDVIKFSSNIGAAKLGFQLGADKMFTYLKDFGFARSTGLGLPGEVSGQMRSAATVKQIELATTAFGQGITSSPVQLASAAATLANGGMRMNPMLLDALLDREGEVESVFEPRVDRRVVSEETAHAIARMMTTVTEQGGTGTRARVEGYTVAGKTGTAQKVEDGVYSPTKRISSFVGFLPADRPEIAMAVVVDTPSVGSRYGGIVAAPVFADIGAFTMRYLGIRPDPPALDEPVFDEHGELVAAAPKPPPARTDPPPLPALELTADGTGGWVLPDLRGRSLRDALAGLEPAGIALEVDGYGRVAEQSPPPGARVIAGQAVHLRFN